MKVFRLFKNIIFSKIDFASLDDIEPFKDMAIEVMREIDINDSPFLALAMSLNCPICSNDGHFKRQDVIKAITTRELMNTLKI
jgi:predicted nucleic acid-binding protein